MIKEPWQFAVISNPRINRQTLIFVSLIYFPTLKLQLKYKMTFHSRSEKETYDIAFGLAKKINKGDILLLEGELGAGKSVFARGLAKGLGVDEAMPSPTFTIVNEYQGNLTVYHFDFYRINDPFELYEIGFEEYLYSGGVSIIEWPSKAGNMLPGRAVKVEIKIKNSEREITIQWKQ